MPANTSRHLREAFRPLANAAELRASAIEIARLLLEDQKIAPLHKRELLGIAIWKMTEAEGGKWGCRYRSTGVVARKLSSIQHEHVVSRKFLVTQLLERPDDCEAIMRQAMACLVTVAEHVRLSHVPEEVEGWQRYEAADVEVLDMITAPGTPVRPWELVPALTEEGGPKASLFNALGAAASAQEQPLVEPQEGQA
jgi:hypothetical protein